MQKGKCINNKNLVFQIIKKNIMIAYLFKDFFLNHNNINFVITINILIIIKIYCQFKIEDNKSGVDSNKLKHVCLSKPSKFLTFS